ncbi:MAG: DEAD/DEAH box helicase [Candidatus Altiarchaeota archaeon]|nr:DEAD/DEAH box helicase [Candidatus Altiarchaeota archaeon]
MPYREISGRLKVKPRLYQEKILATAAKDNTLVVLPTGLGKTLIAIMMGLLREKKGKVLLLAPTKPLVEQHAKSIETSTGIVPVVLSGKIPRSKRLKLWESADWIVATPQTVQNDLLRGQKLNEVSLLVFDEAHRAVGEYAYVYIAQKYKDDAINSQVLALTASPGKDQEKIKEIMNNLFIKNVEIRTEADADVRPYVGNKMITWLEVKLSDEYKQFTSKIKNVLRKYVRALKQMDLLGTANLNRIRKMDLIEIQKGAEDPDAMSYSAAAIKCMHALEMAETQSIEAYGAYLKKLETDRSRAARELLVQLPPPTKNMEHPKMTRLMGLIKKSAKDGQIIVFSHFRHQGKEIVSALEAKGVSAQVFVGQREGMSQKQQKATIDAFKREEFQVLVSTSVGEEGIDIPSVKLIVFYEPVPSSIRLIQRKGRLRGGGKVKILATSGTKEQAYLYSSRRREWNMIQTLRSMRPGGKILVRTPKGQKVLGSFIPQGVEVIIDDREFDLAKRLEGATTQRLLIGDIIISDRIAIERKTAADFVNSIVDGRLFKQMTKLQELYDNPLLLIEGNDLYTHRAVHPNAIRGALASLVINKGVPVIFTKDLDETADFIKVLAVRETKEGRSPSVKTPKASNLKQQQEFLVASLPGINLVLARRLLEAFSSPINIFRATTKELSGVEGVGPKKAKTLARVLSTKNEE